MNLNLELTSLQEKGLSLAVERFNQSHSANLTPEEYLTARLSEVLDSYASELQREEVATIAEALKSAPEAEKAAVFAALKLERPERSKP